MLPREKTTGLLTVGDVQLEISVRGTGEPMLLIPTALTADELEPIARQLSAQAPYQIISFRRRGYGQSSNSLRPGSIVRDADDCRNLLAALGVDLAHVVGVSYSAAVALQLAVDASSVVHSLVVIEPPPTQTPNAMEFSKANQELLEVFTIHGPDAALDEFLTRLSGPNWRVEYERLEPGSVAQMERDASTFFESDIPALLSWAFDADEARRITQPTLYIGGTESGEWFTAVRDLMIDWLQPEDVVVEAADHSLAMTHPEEIADAIAHFVGKHPISG